jgi:hypothetical protein
LEINLQTGIKGELKGLILCLTHWIEDLRELVLLSESHQYFRCSGYHGETKGNPGFYPERPNAADRPQGALLNYFRTRNLDASGKPWARRITAKCRSP